MSLARESVALELLMSASPPSPNNCCSGGDGGDHDQNFQTMVGHLVSEGFLPSIPKAPISDNPYMHYNYGAGTAPGYLLITYLESVDRTLTGPFNSCRPFTNNWCSGTGVNTSYCLCHPY